MYEKYKNKLQEEDLLDRKAYLVEFKFETILNEIVEYSRWIRLEAFRNGLKSANEMELLDRAITIGNKSYSTKHIVHIHSKVIKERYVKKSVKKKKGGYKWSSLTVWGFDQYPREDELEEV